MGSAGRAPHSCVQEGLPRHSPGGPDTAPGVGTPAPPGHRSSPPRRCVWLTLPRFRSPIRSASFLLRQQQGLPTKQAAGTHVRSLARRLERRSSGSLRVNGFGSWAGGRSPCGSRGPAPHPDIPSLLMDSTPFQDHKWKSRHDRDPAHGAVHSFLEKQSLSGRGGPSPCVPRIWSHQGGRDPAQASPGSCWKGGAAPPLRAAWGWHCS